MGYIDIFNYLTKYGEEDIHIQKGEFVGVKGEGTELFLDSIGLLKPNMNMKYSINNKVIKYNQKELNHLKNNFIGNVSIKCNLISNRTVIENVMLPLIFEGNMKQTTMVNKCLAILENLDIIKYSNKKVISLTYAEKIIVLLARSIVNNQEIVIIDDIIKNLDRVDLNYVFGKLIELYSHNYTIVVDANHDKVCHFCKRIILLGEGKE